MMRVSDCTLASAVLRLASVVAGAVAIVAVANPLSAAAGACGDNIDGERVACSCGDTVVTDTTLYPTDPVANEPCADDGLVIFVPADSDGITLHLGGQSITGRGRGSGIHVARGGRLGSTIIGGDAEDTRAEIANFRTGIRAAGRSELREVRALDVHGNRDDGLRIRSSGVRVEDVQSTRNGRDGVAVSGHANEITGVVAGSNVRDGIQVRGSGAKVDAESVANRRSGSLVTGRNHDVSGLASSDNAGRDLETRPGATK